jgi:hypothetical protein
VDGDTDTDIFVTVPTADVGTPVGVGGPAATWIPPRFPVVVTTLVDTQHRLFPSVGLLTSSHVPSTVLPTISAVCPGCNIVVTDHVNPGPERQLTGCPFGAASGTLKRGIVVGVGVGASTTLCVATSGTTTAVVGVVGVGVTPVAPTNGQLQATIMMAANARRTDRCLLMHSPSVVRSYYVKVQPGAICHLSSLGFPRL